MADAAFIARVDGALNNLNARMSTQHKNLQDLSTRLQNHEGIHDPYLAKVDRLEGALSAMQDDLNGTKMYAQENRANINILRGQLDQTGIAQRINKLE